MHSEWWFYAGPEIVAWAVISLYVFAVVLVILGYLFKKLHEKLNKIALIVFAVVLFSELGLYLFKDHFLAKLNNLTPPFSVVYFISGWFGILYLLSAIDRRLDKPSVESPPSD